MHVTVVTPPAPVVTLDEAKSALRIDDDDDDVYVEGLIAAATAWIDGPAGWLGLSIGRQTLEARFDCFEDRVLRLPFGPVPEDSLVELKYLATNGAEQTFAPAGYMLLSGGRIWLRADYSWPSLADTPEAVRITYDAGHDDVPAPIKQAVLLLVGQWFHNREAVVVGQAIATVPNGVDALLSPFRAWL